MVKISILSFLERFKSLLGTGTCIRFRLKKKNKAALCIVKISNFKFLREIRIFVLDRLTVKAELTVDI